jgi:hypothetical protein
MAIGVSFNIEGPRVAWLVVVSLVASHEEPRTTTDRIIRLAEAEVRRNKVRVCLPVSYAAQRIGDLPARLQPHDVVTAPNECAAGVLVELWVVPVAEVLSAFVIFTRV